MEPAHFLTFFLTVCDVWKLTTYQILEMQKLLA
jgi:hypothetical protein